MARPRGRAVASMLHETLTYHGDVFIHLPDRLEGAPPRDYLAQYASLVAESSRIMEPFFWPFVEGVIGKDRGKRILELGCGSGAYLGLYAALHREHRGVGIDIDAQVVDAAKTVLNENGHSDRFALRQGDMREADAFVGGPYDVITAYQNVYYFDAAERVAIWRSCKRALAQDGRVLIVTPTSGGPMSDYFSLILLSTIGCNRLPSIDELSSELREAGFDQQKRTRLVPGDQVWGISAG